MKINTSGLVEDSLESSAYSIPVKKNADRKTESSIVEKLPFADLAKSGKDLITQNLFGDQDMFKNLSADELKIIQDQYNQLKDAKLDENGFLKWISDHKLGVSVTALSGLAALLYGPKMAKEVSKRFASKRNMVELVTSDETDRKNSHQNAETNDFANEARLRESCKKINELVYALNLSELGITKLCEFLLSDFQETIKDYCHVKNSRKLLTDIERQT